MQKLVNTLFFIVLISLVLFSTPAQKMKPKNIEIITLTDSAIVVKDTFFINNKMIRIPSANFTMGCNFFNSPDCESDEFPIFRVQLSDYDISSIEVTQGLWILIMVIIQVFLILLLMIVAIMKTYFALLKM